MDENHPSFDVQDRRFEEKDPEFDDFLSGLKDTMPHFKGFTPAMGDARERGLENAEEA